MLLHNILFSVENRFRPVYGCTLSDHLRVTGREISLVIEECILYLMETAMEVEVSEMVSFSYTRLQ